ncbi:hypothetical protein F7734_04430 [Scytonema sp. UIC 10036]|uniref:hypothetical protein n=1 Tax=Scytonema sp. UIC 10036 TaxID=2304196 RepID=UPI0012DA5D17|nr:hypothetical protein [Scytonema sp. UIC 10036]MUG91766.1 hypothetical protein [Scytonema sp. UIC 10036]
MTGSHSYLIVPSARMRSPRRFIVYFAPSNGNTLVEGVKLLGASMGWLSDGTKYPKGRSRSLSPD